MSNNTDSRKFGLVMERSLSLSPLQQTNKANKQMQLFSHVGKYSRPETFLSSHSAMVLGILN